MIRSGDLVVHSRKLEAGTTQDFCYNVFAKDYSIYINNIAVFRADNVHEAIEKFWSYK
jgi:hypothetical protein